MIVTVTGATQLDVVEEAVVERQEQALLSLEGSPLHDAKNVGTAVGDVIELAVKLAQKDRPDAGIPRRARKQLSALLYNDQR